MFCINVQTGQEQTACNILNRLLDRKESVAFIPQIELIFRNSRLARKELKPMFPGYIFTDSELDEKTFITQAYSYARYSKCIFRLLGNQNIDCMKLSEDEKIIC